MLSIENLQNRNWSFVSHVRACSLLMLFLNLGKKKVKKGKKSHNSEPEPTSAKISLPNLSNGPQSHGSPDDKSSLKSATKKTSETRSIKELMSAAEITAKNPFYRRDS